MFDKMWLIVFYSFRFVVMSFKVKKAYVLLGSLLKKASNMQFIDLYF